MRNFVQPIDKHFQVWSQISRTLAKTAHKLKLLPSEQVRSISGDQANEVREAGAVLWGANSRGRASRARKELGWEPKEESIEDSMTELLEKESKALDTSSGHAAVAAGDV